jgi:hypothetical protein
MMPANRKRNVKMPQFINPVLFEPSLMSGLLPQGDEPQG